jgi:hypothetical protein
MGGWRRMDNVKFHNLYTSPNIIRGNKPRRMQWVVHLAHMVEMRKAHKILVTRPEGKRPLKRMWA